MPDIAESRILIIATNGFEQAELEVPRDKLRAAGAKVDVASPDGKEIRGWDKTDWGQTAPVELKIADARCSDYHALVIPNAGAKWIDKEVVVDNGIITSRNPGDLDAFTAKIIEEVGEGRHVRRHAAE